MLEYHAAYYHFEEDDVWYIVMILVGANHFPCRR
jgi:hypothetical protein